MSHGPSITIHDITEENLRKEHNHISELFMGLEIGTKKEREYVVQYITKMLLDRLKNDEGEPLDDYLFAFWNHREGQEVEDYDILCNLFEEYGKIVCDACCCLVLVSADYRDYYLLCYDGSYYILKHDDASSLDKYIENLQLKADVIKGEEAKKKLLLPKKPVNKEVKNGMS